MKTSMCMHACSCAGGSCSVAVNATYSVIEYVLNPYSQPLFSTFILKLSSPCSLPPALQSRSLVNCFVSVCPFPLTAVCSGPLPGFLRPCQPGAARLSLRQDRPAASRPVRHGPSGMQISVLHPTALWTSL